MAFDATAFVNTVYQDAASTEMINVPEGQYVGSITKLNPRSVQIDGEDRVVVDVTFEIQDMDGAVAAATGRDKNTVRMGLFLDMTGSGNDQRLDLSRGRNVALGRLRDALGQNDPGKPWNFNNLIGGVCRIDVSHSIDGDKTYANVKKVAAL